MLGAPNLAGPTGWPVGQPNELNVGGDNPDGSVADVDDLRLFDSPISATNVQWLYQNTGQYYDSTPTAFAAWGVPL